MLKTIMRTHIGEKKTFVDLNALVQNVVINESDSDNNSVSSAKSTP